MDDHVNGFLKYLAIEKSSSHNTIVKYKADLGRLNLHLSRNLNISNPTDITVCHLRQYIEYIRDLASLSPANGFQ
jgi:site-specific recombinase XerD